MNIHRIYISTLIYVLLDEYSSIVVNPLLNLYSTYMF
nr:MAG TPA: hypothetical protein [Caudoviricetes sp.]